LATDKPLLKVVFKLDDDDPFRSLFASERIWCRGVGKYRFYLENIPFFVRGLAYGDLVQAVPDHEIQEFVFDHVLERSGHSTLRILFMDESEDLRNRVLSGLEALGCRLEATNTTHHLSLDVPPESSYVAVRELLGHYSGDVGYEEAFVHEAHLAQLSGPVA
jgi:hypothetical protein